MTTRQVTCAGFNSMPNGGGRRRERDEWDRPDRRATAQSDPAFLERITVNFIRHELTTYGRGLEREGWAIGAGEAVATLRRRVLAEVARTYPAYAKECERQRRGRRAADGPDTQ